MEREQHDAEREETRHEALLRECEEQWAAEEESVMQDTEKERNRQATEFCDWEQWVYKEEMETPMKRPRG